MSYSLITCIVEEGKAKEVVEAAIRAGAQAATFFPARGRGVRERIGPLGKLIKVEKEVILIVTESDHANIVFDEIVATGRLKDPGRGFAYIQPVERAIGFID